MFAVDGVEFAICRLCTCKLQLQTFLRRLNRLRSTKQHTGRLDWADRSTLATCAAAALPSSTEPRVGPDCSVGSRRRCCRPAREQNTSLYNTLALLKQQDNCLQLHLQSLVSAMRFGDAGAASDERTATGSGCCSLKGSFMLAFILCCGSLSSHRVISMTLSFLAPSCCLQSFSICPTSSLAPC